uniref:hypothetical protein n=1 Tax=Jeotgalibaca porci TaxID=1868793 RepID=UPI0035A11053
MVAERKYEKKVVFNGVENIYTRFMTTEDNGTVEPVYDATEISEVPSLQDFDGTVEFSEDPLYLSNVIHDNDAIVTAVNININAAYLGTGVAEKAQGMIEEGAGAWSMPTSPNKVPFSLTLIETDKQDGEVIWIFPKATLSPMNIAGATRNAGATNKIPTHTIRALPLTYKTSGEPRKPYFKIDLTTEEAQAEWDREKLLTMPIYNSATLAACKNVPAG